MATIITIDKVPALLAIVETLTRNHVLVGIPGDVPPRRPDGTKRTPLTNPTIGYIQEFGSPAANIPARPFLRPGVNSSLAQVESRMRTAARKALTLPADPDVAMVALHAVGLLVQNHVRRYINAGVPPPLAASTLYKRRTRKVAPRTGTKPLIDTGALRNSITYVIRKVGSRQTIARGVVTP